MNTENILYLTDSYKQTHFKMYPKGTQNIYSYFESRNGAKYPTTTFFGLQFYLKKYLEGSIVTKEDIDEAEEFYNEHFMGAGEFNRPMWEHIVNKHGGKLPIRIKAVPEGTSVPISNVLMTVEVTDETLREDGVALVAPLTNYLETILTHVWASSNVATISGDIKRFMANAFSNTVEEKDYWFLDYMLHDFGFRGVSSVQSAGMSGAGHLTSFAGTDTVVAVKYGQDYYDSSEMLGHSVNATEHSIGTSRGPEGEFDVVNDLLDKFPTGILSVVADSYDIVNFVKTIGSDPVIKKKILERDGKFVVRPDSPRFEGDTPDAQILWIVDQLERDFGSTKNSKGYLELNPKVGVIYGDGLSVGEIKTSINFLVTKGWAASTCIYGMGGGLLQKHNRDTQRNAFKCSARLANDEWQDVFKQPKDITKASKKGRFSLDFTDNGSFKTVREGTATNDILRTVFENGEVFPITFSEVRENVQKSLNLYCK